MPLPGGRPGDPDHGPPGGRQRYPGHELHSQPGRADRGPIRFCVLRPAGDRRRHGPGRAAIGGEARPDAGHVPGAIRRARRRHRADPPQHGARLGGRRRPLAAVDHRGRHGQSASAACGEARDALEEGQGRRPRCPARCARPCRTPRTSSAAPRRQRRAEALAKRGLLLEQWDLDNIHADLERCGLAGSPTKVYRVQAIVLSKEGHTEIPPTEEGVRRLIHELVVDRTLG